MKTSLKKWVYFLSTVVGVVVNIFVLSDLFVYAVWTSSYKNLFGYSWEKGMTYSLFGSFWIPDHIGYFQAISMFFIIISLPLFFYGKRKIKTDNSLVIRLSVIFNNFFLLSWVYLYIISPIVSGSLS